MKKAATSITSPTRTTSSTSGNGPTAPRGAPPRSACGPASAPSRSPRSPRAGARLPAAADAACVASSPLDAQRAPLGAGGRSPLAKGQPEESLTRHQPISIPSSPQRGRECQCRQPGSPMSSLETDHPAVPIGRGDHSLEQAPVRLLDVGASAELGPRVAQPQRRARRGPARARRSSSTRGPPTAPTPQSIPRRGKADANSSPSSRSSRAIWRRRSSRARRLASSVGAAIARQRR